MKYKIYLKIEGKAKAGELWERIKKTLKLIIKAIIVVMIEKIIEHFFDVFS